MRRRAENTPVGGALFNDDTSCPWHEGSKDRVCDGKLVEHGPAPYQFDEQKARSYFVKLETPSGPRTQWGVDLARAFTESKTRPQIGDEISFLAPESTSRPG